MTNDLFSFSAHEFEEFARALAASVFGPGVVAFGNGPDGGRDATFRGRVPYPYPPDTTWEGYGVIQAKCKEKPETTAANQKWVLAQLRAELDAFVSRAARLPKPEYYVLVTNVELSSTPSGGKDQADQLIRSFYGRLPLKGHAVWDASELAMFLARYGELRKRFVRFLTSTDLLSVVMEKLTKARPGASRAVTDYLERELRAEEAARLDQGGNNTDEQLHLATLFFDLPAAAASMVEAPVEVPDSTGRLPAGVLHELLLSGAHRWDSRSLYSHERTSADARGSFAARFVLLGGPGCGKSTIGQFLAQIHRAALLEQCEPHELMPKTREIIRETSERCAREGLPWPLRPRYPVRIELGRLAAAMADRTSNIESLNGFILRDLAPHGELDHTDFTELLEKQPWLLILDGLDEVPAASNRREVLLAIDDFLAVARRIGADLFVVATSRQQGYEGELAGSEAQFRYLLPLSTERALRYAERYVRAIEGRRSAKRAEDVLAQLRHSTQNPLTAQLLSSPLQVTFLATVVADRGDPGQNRWQLFENYYRTVYARELKKAVPPYDDILRRYPAIVERLHHDIGFWLQFIGESSRRMAVTVPIRQFEELVQRYLRELGHEGPLLLDDARHICDAARHRLIFLTSRTANELSFEVRSLQEYMASECLLTGNADLIRKRLRSIARSAYWRNVLMFVVSKCFADTRSRYLQDAVQMLCHELSDPDDSAGDIAKLGADLALDILRGDALGENLTFARRFASLAMGLAERAAPEWELPDGASPQRHLAAAYRHGLDRVYQERLTFLLGHADLERALGAWPIVLKLASQDVPWAAELARTRWPANPLTQVRVLCLVLPELGASACVEERVSDTVRSISPADALKLLPEKCVTGSDLLCTVGRLLLLNPYRRTARVDVGGSLYSAPFISITTDDPNMLRDYRACRVLQSGHPEWLALSCVAEFLSTPNATTLASILQRFSDASTIALPTQLLTALPWPLASCLAVARDAEDLQRLARAAQKGRLGSTADWARAEERWVDVGLSDNDLVVTFDEGAPFTAAIAQQGWPRVPFHFLTAQPNYSAGAPNALLTLYEVSPLKGFWNGMPWTVSAVLQQSEGTVRSLDPARLQQLFETEQAQGRVPSGWSADFVPSTEMSREDAPIAWINFFDWLGRSDRIFEGYPYDRATDLRSWTRTWVSAILQNRLRTGLLRLLSYHVTQGAMVSELPLLDPNHFDDPRIAISALILRLTRWSNADEARKVAAEARRVLAILDEPNDEARVLQAVMNQLDHITHAEEFLRELYLLTPDVDADRNRGRIERLLRMCVRRNPTELQQPGRLEELELPRVATHSS